MPTKEELLEQAKELDVEGRSTMSKDELAEAVSKAEQSSHPDPSDPDHVPEGRVGLVGKDTSVPDDEKGAVARGEAIAVDEEKAKELKERTVTKEEGAKRADERLETVKEEAGPETAELVAHELDKGGPLHTEDPRTRTMTGAVNEDHAKEQEKLLKDKPDYQGFNSSLVSEAGYPEEPENPTRYSFPDGEYDEKVAQKAENERFKADGVDIRPLSEQYKERAEALDKAQKERDRRK